MMTHKKGRPSERAPLSSACSSLDYIVLLVVALPVPLMSTLPVAFMSMLLVAFMSTGALTLRSVVPAFTSVALYSALLALLLLPHAASAVNAVAIASLLIVFICFPLGVAERTATANGETIGSQC